MTSQPDPRLADAEPAAEPLDFNTASMRELIVAAREGRPVINKPAIEWVEY